MKILLLIAHAHAVLIPWDLCHLLNTNWDILDEILELSYPPLTAMDTRYLKSKKGTKALHAPLIVRLQSYKAPRNLLCTKKTVCLNYSIKMSCNQKVQKRNQKKKKNIACGSTAIIWSSKNSFVQKKVNTTLSSLLPQVSVCVYYSHIHLENYICSLFKILI